MSPAFSTNVLSFLVSFSVFFARIAASLLNILPVIGFLRSPNMTSSSFGVSVAYSPPSTSTGLFPYVMFIPPSACEGPLNFTKSGETCSALPSYTCNPSILCEGTCPPFAICALFILKRFCAPFAIAIFPMLLSKASCCFLIFSGFVSIRLPTALRTGLANPTIGPTPGIMLTISPATPPNVAPALSPPLN